MSKKLLQRCPNCDTPFTPGNYISGVVNCSQCHSSFSSQARPDSVWSRHHKKIVLGVLLLGALQFAFIVNKNWDRIMKKDSHISTYIKHYWNDLQEDKLLAIIQQCHKKNDFQCQMLAYKKLTEIDPNNEFYKKNYRAKLQRYENPPRLILPEDF